MKHENLFGEKPILEGSLHALFFKSSPPGIMGLLLLGLNNFADGAFVGRLINADALAGVTFAYPMTQLLVGLASLVGTGGAAALSILIGAKDLPRISKVLNSVMLVGSALGCVGFLAFYLFPEALIASMGATGAAAQYGVEYLKASAFGSWFTVLGLGLNVLIRSEGKMLAPMLMFSIGFAVNMILAPVFISVMDWGVAGAAHATNLSMGVAFLANYAYFFTARRRELYRPMSFVLDGELLKRIIRLGTPGLSLYVLTLIQQFVVMRFLLSYGSNQDVAYFGAVSRVMTLCVVPVYGMSRALQPIVGINFGATQYQRCVSAYRIFNVWGLLLNVAIFAAVAWFSDGVLKMILPELSLGPSDQSVFIMFLSTILAQPLLIFSMVYFQSVGKSGLAAGLVSLRQLLLFTPLTFLLTSYFRVRGVYYSYLVVDLAVLVLCILSIRLEHRRYLQLERA